ncbi:hypothetical protein E3O53_04630 [Cryobacterium sp. TMT2-18-3]|nr:MULTISPECIES: hypothetical protein [unclassified Cryobacterium]TFC37940.1 hypothetical protein E3O18_04555 [Cryobacterium sp. TMT2-42-4]TFC65822.1 hypothetical protein E3O53_04630 [Cryobacterium sp. TMT2-18-3]
MTLEQFVLSESATSLQPGLTYDRLIRIQRGETLMQLADLFSWARRFDTVRAILADERNWPAAANRNSPS